MWVWSLGWEEPLEEGMATHSVFLPRESHGQRSLVGYGPWGHKESDTTEVTYHIQSCYIFLQRVLDCPDCGHTVTAFTQTKTQSCDKETRPNASCMWSSRHPQPDCMLQPPHFWILCYSRLAENPLFKADASPLQNSRVHQMTFCAESQLKRWSDSPKNNQQSSPAELTLSSAIKFKVCAEQKWRKENF